MTGLPDWLEEELLADEPEADPATAARDDDASKSLSELAEELRSVREQLGEARATKASLQARFDLLRRKLLPDLMQAMDMVDARGRGSVTVAGVQLNIKNDVFVSYAKETEGKVFEELEALGDGALIKRTLNKNTLRAHVRGALAEGRTVPGSITVTPTRSVTLTVR